MEAVKSQTQSSEKQFLLNRLKELINLEEKQIQDGIDLKKKSLKDQRKRQSVELTELLDRQNMELSKLKDNQTKEKSLLETNFNERSDYLQKELHLLEEELRNISAPVQLLSSSLMSASSPLAAASKVTSMVTSSSPSLAAVEDMSEDLECCNCGVICRPPAHILQCPEGEIISSSVDIIHLDNWISSLSGDILCQRCADKIETCPECQVQLKGRISRNKVLENIAHNFYQM